MLNQMDVCSLKFFEPKGGNYHCNVEGFEELFFRKDGYFKYEDKKDKKNSKNILEIELEHHSVDKIEALLYDWSEWLKDRESSLKLRVIVYDSIEISKYIDNYVSLLFIKSLIVFTNTFDNFDPIYMQRNKDLKFRYFSLITKARKNKLEKVYYKGLNVKQINKEKLFAAESYLELCMDDDNQDWFDLNPTIDKTQNENQTDTKTFIREGEVNKITRYLIDLKPDSVDQIDPMDSKKLDLLIQKARTWLMLRYDIDKAAYYQFYNHPFWLKVFKILPEICGLIVILSLAFINHQFWEGIEGFKLPIYRDLDISNIALLALYAVFVAEGIVLVHKIKSGKNQTQVFMPRVAGGIIVGYFAVMIEEMWMGLYRQSYNISQVDHSNWLMITGRILIPLLAIYIYLLIEMSNVKGIGNIHYKALRILMRGYSYSLMLGVIFCDIFGENLVNIVKENLLQIDASVKYSHFEGIWGNIYPEPILLLSPLALFIGVFLQLLWEDKAVTEKI